MNEPITIDTSNAGSPYAAANAGAIADLEATQGPAAPAIEPAGGTPPADPAAAAAAATPALTPSDILELKVRDKVEKLSLTTDREKLIEYAQKGLDYTQKTQAAAQERQQIEQYAQALQAREAEIATFLRDPQKVVQYAQLLLSQQGPQAQAQDPNAVATVADLQSTLASELQKVRAETAQAVAAAQFQADTTRYQSEYEADLTKVARSAIEKFPILDSVADTPEELVDLLKGDLAKSGKAKDITTIEEARDAMANLAKARADRLHAKVNDHAKMEAVRAAKLVKTGTEPPGGTAPAGGSPQHFKLGDPRLTAQAVADMIAGKQ